MNELKSQGTRARPAMSEAERNFWGEGALLPGVGAGYSGHLRAEVWADGFVWLMMSDPRLIGPALLALADSNPVTSSVRPLPDKSAMSDRSDAEFLGRVILDFRTGGQPVVGAIGHDSGRLVNLVAARLRQLS